MGICIQLVLGVFIDQKEGEGFGSQVQQPPKTCHEAEMQKN